jgi:hypothetical protein
MPSADPPDPDPRTRLQRADLPTTADIPLWTVIRNSTDSISFRSYGRAVDDLMGTSRLGLKEATEAFLADEVAIEEDAEAESPPAPPQLVELIWSYWLEEGRLTETMKAISLRFQNIRQGRRDPLAELKIDVLRPLGRLLWQYVQDEHHRLTARRRAYEYEHQYGLRVTGAADSPKPVESRSRFPGAFDDLLQRAAEFYAEADIATADASPVLQALRKVHLLLAEGAHNQFGDLPRTARQEMLMEQWILARPEFDDYLPSSAAFPEPWMARVDAMRRLQGWGDTSIQHFRDLATFGEQVLLSVRFGDWSAANVDQAAGWARFWRREVEGYIAAFRAVNAG